MSMTRRQRLMASLEGRPVDRPPVSFYEIDGAQDTSDKDPYNIFSDPTWAPAIALAREKTDRIVRMGIGFKNAPPDPLAELTRTRHWEENGSRFGMTEIRAGTRTLTTRWRRDRDVDTVWTTEHLLKDVDDFKAWLELPEPVFGGEPDTDRFLRTERELGEDGICMIDSGDPICSAAPLFDMGTFTVMAMTEPELFRKALDRFARIYWPRTEAIAKALPGRLWRICGPEYASPPYLPPRLFEEYVVAYDTPMVRSILKHGGFPRIHSHGRLKDILDLIAATGCTGLDPIEPPPQGDVSLEYVRRNYGAQMTLFGNIEASEIENLEPAAFEKRVAQAIREGTAGSGRGFVLHPSACPYGRKLSARAMRNYETMVRLAERG